MPGRPHKCSCLCSQESDRPELEEAPLESSEALDPEDPDKTETEERVTLDVDEEVDSSSISEVMKGGSGAGSEHEGKPSSRGTGSREPEGSEGGGSTGQKSKASDEGRSAGM